MAAGTFIALALLGSDQRVLTLEDALITIEDVSGPVQVVGDLDGDGLDDLVLERGERQDCSQPTDVVAVSLRTGETLQTLWSFAEGDPSWWTCTVARLRERWDARGDADGDGIFDLLVGEWRAGDEHVKRSGAVFVVSGATGEVLHRTAGTQPLDGYGFSLAWLGDLDGDGCDDYAVGAPQAKVEEIVYTQSMAKSIITSYPHGEPVVSLELEDGSVVLRSDFVRRRLDGRSDRPGYVSVRSGADGRELARFTGERAGHGFGTRVVNLGDIDGDGRGDLGVAPAAESETPLRLISVAEDAELAQLPNFGGLFGACGDIDGSGGPDLFQIRMDPEREKQSGGIQLSTGDGWRERLHVLAPDSWSKFTLFGPLGDLDGDGRPEFAIGEANFGILGPQQVDDPKNVIDVRALTLEQLLTLSSDPWVGFTCGWESGCVWVESGWPPTVTLAVYGLPGVREGIGMWVERAPDFDGDGRADLLVTTANRAHVFSTKGLGPASGR